MNPLMESLATWEKRLPLVDCASSGFVVCLLAVTRVLLKTRRRLAGFIEGCAVRHLDGPSSLDFRFACGRSASALLL